MNGTRLLAAVIGFWVLMRAVNKDATGRTLIDHVLGRSASQSPLLGTQLAPRGGTSTSSAGAVDPFPGATGSRLDQGFDLTTRQLLAPFNGVVLKATQSDPGWKGGGYLAIQSLADPSKVIYMAEGLAPAVQVGQQVQAGQPVAHPAINPYNGIPGNIEAGWASPITPGQPLAQTVQNRPAAATSFYQWLLGLGGPRATATAGAGYP
jgi:biotin carboxyl carrier protein